MEKCYLIIETEGPFKSSLNGLKLAVELAEQSILVKVWFMQDAVQLFQLGKHTLVAKFLDESLTRYGIEFHVDRFSIKQRGLGNDTVGQQGVHISDENTFIKHLMQKRVIAIWH